MRQGGGDLVSTDEEEGSLVKADEEVDSDDEFPDAEDGTKNELDFADEEDDLTTAQQRRTRNVLRHSIGGTENPYHPDFPPKIQILLQVIHVH